MKVNLAPQSKNIDLSDCSIDTLVKLSEQRATSLVGKKRITAQRRSTLAGGNPQLPSTLKSLTSVFGMGTGVTSLPSLLDYERLFFQNWINCDMKVYLVKSSTYQYSSTPYIAALPSRTYLPDRLSGVLLTCVMGNLILRGASCLDAFSTYPVHTQLPSDAFGKTTGTPAVCPSRSSRTKDSSSQISYAHDGQGPNCLTTF